jgi:hypothetical protein
MIGPLICPECRLPTVPVGCDDICGARPEYDEDEDDTLDGDDVGTCDVCGADLMPGEIEFCEECRSEGAGR